MPRSAALQSHEVISRLMEFANFLGAAHGSVGAIVLPRKLFTAVKDLRSTMGEITAIVQAIDFADCPLCKRLDREGLVVLSRVLSRSEACLAQQRGLCLIAEALYHDRTDTTEEVAAKASKKNLLGKHALSALISGFVDVRIPMDNRRWMGILALELLVGCPENTTRLQQLGILKLGALSEVIKHGRCQVLRLVAGSLIRILLHHGLSPGELWPHGTDKELYAHFPKNSHHDTSWILAFEAFIDEYVIGDVITHRSDILFAYALSVGNTIYNTEGESAILVTIDEALKIIVSASPTGSAKYVDVPLENIRQVALESQLNEQSQTPSYALVIDLALTNEHTHYLNAVGRNDERILLAFMSDTHANTVRNTILSSQRHVVAASQPQQPTDYARTVRNCLMNMSQATSQIGRCLRTPIVPATTSTPTSAFRIETRPLSVSGTSLRPDDAETIKLAASTVFHASQGIPVGLLSNTTNSQTGIEMQKPAVSSAMVGTLRPPTQDGPPRDLGMVSKNRLSVSMTAQTWPAAIENAPKLASLTRPHPEQNIRQATPHEDPGYESSYDVSPRPTKDHSTISEGQISPSPVTMQASIQRGEVSTRSGKDSGPLKKAHYPKISESSRVNDGRIEVGLDSLPSVDRVMGSKLVKRSAEGYPISWSKIASSKGNEGVQKTQPAKAALLEKQGARHALDEKDEAYGDEFDLPKSPAKPNLMATVMPFKANIQDRSQEIPRANMMETSRKAAAAPQRATNAKPALTSKAPKSTFIPATKDQKLLDVEEEIETNWDPNLESNDDDYEVRPRPTTRAKVSVKGASKLAKADDMIKVQLKAKKPETRKAARAAGRRISTPATPKKPRSRRAAADKANLKIMRMENIDDFLDDDEDLSPTKTQKELVTVKMQVADAAQVQKSTENTESHALSVPNESRAGKTITTKVIAPPKDVKVNMKIQRGLEIGDFNKVDLVCITPRVTRKTKTIPATPSPLIAEEPIVGSGANLPDQGDAGAIGDMSSAREKYMYETEAQQFNKHPVFENVPVVLGKTQESDRIATTKSIIEDGHDLAPVRMIGDADDSHFQEALPDKEYMYKQVAEMSPEKPQSTLKPDSFKKASHPKSKTKYGRYVEYLQSASSPSRPKTETTKSRPRDPFAAKLRFLIQEPEQTVSGIGEVTGPRISHIAANFKQATAGVAQATAADKTGLATKVRQVGQAVKHDDIENIESPQESDIKAIAREISMHNPQTHQKSHPKRQNAKSKLQSKVKKIPLRRQKVDDDTPKPEKDISRLPDLTAGDEWGLNDDGRPEQKAPEIASTKEGIKPSNDGGRDTGNPIVTNHPVTELRKEAKHQTPVPDLSRRPEIISFSAKGPLNQGTVSTRQAKPDNSFRAREKEIPAMTAKEVRSSKRESWPHMDDPALWANGPLAKRHNRGIMTTPATQKHLPRVVHEPEPMSTKERPHRLGSQSTKVNENGSPIPLACAEINSPAALGSTVGFGDMRGAYESAQSENDKDQPITRNSDYYSDEITLPFPRNKHLEHKNKLGFVGLLNSNKQVPSSPHAPSTFTNMPAHHVYQNGYIVNPKTAERIVPKELHDPFVGGRTKQTSSFIETLRKLNDQDLQRPGNGPKEQMLTVGLPKRSPLHNCDAENTLVEPTSIPRKSKKRNLDPGDTAVEPGPVQKKSKYENSSTSVSSFEAFSSEDESLSDAMVPYQSDTEALALWYKTLEPHQGEMLDVLSNISHRLIRHLVSEETAIQDIVKDYSTDGNNLVSAFEKSRQETFKSHKESLDQRRHQLRSSLGKIQAEMTETPKEMRRQRTSDMEKQWMEQQRLMAAVKAAIDACDD